MTESELLADLLNYFLAVSPDPLIIKPEDNKLITRMSVEVCEVGSSEKDKKPIGQNKSIEYLVYKRGQGGLEQAFYLGDQPYNTSLKDVTIVTSSYENIAFLYNSEVLQNRTLSAIITYCSVVFLEDPGTTNHANRMKLVAKANDNLLLVIMEFMCAVALNATVQAQGTSVLDSVIYGIVGGAWNAYASLIVA